MTSRVRIIKRNRRSYIVYRRLHNYRMKLNLLTGIKTCHAEFLYKGKKRSCKRIGCYWVAHI